MKHLISYNSKSDYYKDYYDGKLSFPHVCKLPDEIIYAETFESESDERLPLYIEAIEDLTVSFSENAIQYSLDNITWVDLPIGTETPTISSGNKIYFRADNPTIKNDIGIGTFTINGQCNVGGNIMSMLYGSNFLNDNTMKSYAFCSLFRNASGILTSDKLILPSNELATYCYKNMFRACHNMTTMPQLPALCLNSYCYDSMFYDCSSLTFASELPARSVYTGSYRYMFRGCRSLVKAPVIDATLAYYYSSNDFNVCYEAFYNMFYGCINLVDASTIKIISEYSGSNSFAYMFYNCTSLVEMPHINVRSCSARAFEYAFYNCISIKKTLDLSFTTAVGDYVYYYAYANCTNLTEVVGSIKTSPSYSTYSYMFYNCTSLEEAPDMLSTGLFNYSDCCDYMFYGCIKLRKIKYMSKETQPSYSSCFTNWVTNVASKGVFIKNSAATWTDTFGVNAIPEGWTVETADA